jgi:hypothetical protein
MKNLVLIIGLGVSFFSCKDKEKTPTDTEAPVFVYALINGETVNDNTEGELLSDTSNTIELHLTDNEELSQINLNVHIIDGEHNHVEAARISTDIDLAPFVYGPIVKNISGKTAHSTFTFDIPKEVKKGEYHVEIIALDKSGNKKAIIYTADLD